MHLLWKRMTQQSHVFTLNFRSGKLKVGSLQALVLDEFDALLEYKPHRDPTRAIMQTLKRRHGDALQSILCSATASDIMDSANVVDFLRPGYATAMANEDDVLVTGKLQNSAQVSRTVLHGVVHLEHRRFALDTIRKILHTEPVPQQILIFAENARKVDIVVEKLANMDIVAAPLHEVQAVKRWIEQKSARLFERVTLVSLLQPNLRHVA